MAQIDLTDTEGYHHRFPNANVVSIKQITPRPWNAEDIEAGIEYVIRVAARGDADGNIEYEYADGYQPDDFRA